MPLGVTTAVLSDWIDPALVYRAVCGDSDAAFWLDSGPDATTGMSYLGLAAEVVTQFDGPVLAWLSSQLRLDEGASDPDSSDRDASDRIGSVAGFSLGWVGWLGYELRAETMGSPLSHRSRYPDAAWLRVDRAIAFDHFNRTVTLLSLGDAETYRVEVEQTLAAFDESSASGPLSRLLAEQSADLRQVRAVWSSTDDEYLAMIRECQRAINDGNAYQLCLTTEVSMDVTPDPVATYLTLRASSPTHHGALIRAGAVSLLSASPERFLTVSTTGVITTSPIKGTRPRGRTEVGDWQLRTELAESDKERAENVMIVDLMRNDIARVCEPGSVDVTKFLAVESYAQVHQLVSTVRGQLLPGLTGIDAIRACFPAGSMTGAPKLSATEILDRLENRARGIYSGVFGYLGLDGAVDLAMVIRSIVLDANGATVGTGGGITALSVPEEELAEAKLKSAALLTLLGVDVVDHG